MTRTRGREWFLTTLCALAALAGFAAGQPGTALMAQGAQGGGGRAGGGIGPPPQPMPPQRGSALVLGQVVDGTTGQPVSEAIVSITSRIPIASLPAGPTPGTPFRLITGADGQFVLHDLPKTNLLISATAAGYVNGSSGQTRPSGLSRPVEVEDGQRLSDLKIRLWKYGVLTGTVLDEAGEPAIGVSVRALRKSSASGKAGFSPSGSGTTDDRGIYRISGLTPGDYTVAVPQAITTMPTAVLDVMLQTVASGMSQNLGLSELAMSGGSPMTGGMRVGNLLVTSSSGVMPPLAPSGRSVAYQALFYPAVSSVAEASIVTLRSGEERSGLDLQLKVVPAARISGTVTGPNGPASMASVRLLPADIDDSGVAAGFEASTANSSTDGTFTFLFVPAGQYVARVMQQPRPAMPPGMADSPIMQLMGGRGGGGPGAGALYAQAIVTVTGADVNGVSLMLGDGIKVGGRLQFDGTATPPVGQPLQAMAVTLTPIGGNTGMSSNPVRPGPDGQFKSQGYPAGKYNVAPTGRGGGAWVLRSATAGGRDVLNDPLELRDADVSDLVITYTDKIGQITGTVHTAGATLPPTTVLMVPADVRTWIARGMNARSLRTVLAQKTGAFVIGNVAAGDYLVAALDDADVPENQDAAFVEALARVATRVQLSEGDKPTIDLQIVKVRR